MRAYLSINQKAFVAIAKQKNIKVDLTDPVLFDWISGFTHSSKSIKKLIDKKLYIWVSYRAIREDNPLMNINNNEVVSRRLNKLVDLGILERYISKKDGNKVFFHITEFAYTHIFEGAELPTQESIPYRLESRELSTQESIPLSTQESSNSKLNNSLKKNKQKKKFSFSFSLSKKAGYESLSAEYKQKLKAKCFILDGDVDRYHSFILQLEAKGYCYKNFVSAYMTWDKDKAYKTHSPDPEPKLGDDWIKVQDGDRFVAINTKTLEMRYSKARSDLG